MILVAGLLAFTSVWGQNTTSGWKDESGKIPVKAYFESGKLHFASKNENFHLWFDNRIYLDAVVYSPTSNVDDLTSKTNKDLEDDDNQFRFSNGVSIRRARFGVKATLYKKWFAELDLDFAYNEVEIKDMYLGYKFNNHFFVKAGNFKVPMSMERTTSSKYLMASERQWKLLLTGAVWDLPELVGENIGGLPPEYLAGKWISFRKSVIEGMTVMLWLPV